MSSNYKKLLSQINSFTKNKEKIHELKLNGYMLYEDIEHKIMPYEMNRESTYSIKLVKEDADIETILASALGSSRAYDLKEGVTEFVRRVSRYLVTDGSVYLKTNYHEDAESPLSINVVSNDDVFSFFDWHCLLEEKSFQKYKIKDSKLVKYKLPNELKKIPDIIKQLSKLRSPTLPDFVMNESSADSGKPPISYDFKTMRMNYELSIGRLSKDIGWPGRGGLGNRVTDYYWMNRNLKFESMIINLREHIFEMLNDLLSKITLNEDVSFSLVVEGLPSESNIKAAREQLRSGDISFAEILKNNGL